MLTIRPLDILYQRNILYTYVLRYKLVIMHNYQVYVLVRKQKLLHMATIYLLLAIHVTASTQMKSIKGALKRNVSRSCTFLFEKIRSSSLFFLCLLVPSSLAPPDWKLKVRFSSLCSCLPFVRFHRPAALSFSRWLLWWTSYSTLPLNTMLSILCIEL